MSLSLSELMTFKTTWFFYCQQIFPQFIHSPSCTNLEICGEEEDVLGEEEDVLWDEEAESEKEEEEPSEQEEVELPKLTRSGLHLKVNSAQAQEAELFVITKSRLIDLSEKALSTCDRCGQAMTVGVSPGHGSAAHVTWVCI